MKAQDVKNYCLYFTVPKFSAATPERMEIMMPAILIVDDQPYIQHLFAVQLMDDDYTIIPAEDIEEARVCLNKFRVDLVILDLYIKGFQGFGLLNEVKEKHPDLPVLIVTAYDNLMNDPRATQADGYLIKNFHNIDYIGQKVHDLLH
jgi:DNA-binding NtrC family response regulator